MGNDEVGVRVFFTLYFHFLVILYVGFIEFVSSFLSFYA